MGLEPRQAISQCVRNWRIALTAAIVAGLACAHLARAQAPAASATPDVAAGAAEEYGEYLARPEELAQTPTNDIVKSVRLNAEAMRLGRQVYDGNCAGCHGADLKGRKDLHAPDLTDSDWQFSGDDLQSGGAVIFPSDVEWTVRFGIRSDHPNARGLEADMLAFDPQYRNAHDLMDYGRVRTVSPEEIEELAEYVLQISGQPADPARAARGNALFHDNAKGNCIDCHDENGTGNPAIGSSNLTEPRLYLYGSDRTSIIESITKGRRGVMPAFEGRLKPEEIKAVSVYVLSRAAR